MNECKICGVVFSFNKPGRSFFCSYECRKEAHRRSCRKSYLKIGHRTRKLYVKSEAGKAAVKRYYDKKNNSPERKEYMRRYMIEHREHLNNLSRNRRQRSDVKLKDAEYQRRYLSNADNWKSRLEYQRSKRKTNGWDRKYYCSDKGKAWIINMNHRRRERIKSGEKVTWLDIRNIYRVAKYRCQRCQATDDLTIDHIVPLAKGGKHEVNNLQVLCRKCNIVKSDKL